MSIKWVETLSKLIDDSPFLENYELDALINKLELKKRHKIRRIKMPSGITSHVAAIQSNGLEIHIDIDSLLIRELDDTITIDCDDINDIKNLFRLIRGLMDKGYRLEEVGHLTYAHMVLRRND